MTSWTIHQRTVDVYPGEKADSPVIYLNTYADVDQSMYQDIRARSGRDFSLVTISKLTWNHDMSPWAAGPISKRDAAFTGGADDYLKLLTDEIVPAAEAALPGRPAWRGLAGYSLAGLFAFYALYRTEAFSRAACMSGSFWFEGFADFVRSHTMKRKPDCVYFSLGDAESSTRNPILNVVQRRTEEIEALCRAQGIESTFVLNSGNHFHAVHQRTAAGIVWILNRSTQQEGKRVDPHDALDRGANRRQRQEPPR